QLDPEVFELGRHRRVDRLVAALDLVAQFARQRRDAAHEGAGDAKNMKLQDGTSLNEAEPDSGWKHDQKRPHPPLRGTFSRRREKGFDTRLPTSREPPLARAGSSPAGGRGPARVRLAPARRSPHRLPRRN